MDGSHDPTTLATAGLPKPAQSFQLVQQGKPPRTIAFQVVETRCGRVSLHVVGGAHDPTTLPTVGLPSFRKCERSVPPGRPAFGIMGRSRDRAQTAAIQVGKRPVAPMRQFGNSLLNCRAHSITRRVMATLDALRSRLLAPLPVRLTLFPALPRWFVASSVAWRDRCRRNAF